MRLNLKTLAALSAASLTVGATTLAANTPILQGVEVTTPEDAAAVIGAPGWAILDSDLTAAIEERVILTGDVPWDVTVDVELTDYRFDIAPDGERMLAGKVKWTYAEQTAAFYVEDISIAVSAGNALFADASVPPSADRMYEVLVDSFADKVAERSEVYALLKAEN